MLQRLSMISDAGHGQSDAWRWPGGRRRLDLALGELDVEIESVRVEDAGITIVPRELR
jgi:hypothetical protein